MSLVIIEEQYGTIVVPKELSSTGKEKALQYFAMLLEKPSKDMQCINGGRIISLVIKDADTGQMLAGYDEGWKMEPSSKDAKYVVDALLRDIDGVRNDEG